MVLAAEIRQEVVMPKGVTASVSGSAVSVKGPKGELRRDFKAERVAIALAGDRITVVCRLPRREDKAMVGTITSHLANMVTGVSAGFKYQLKVVYSHFPVNVSVQGDKVVIKNFLGEKFPRQSQIVGSAKVEVKAQDITVSGASLEDVGQTAANMVLNTKIGRKDPRVFLDGIFLADRGD
jgi:large subunit ribosomal protein L6